MHATVLDYSQSLFNKYVFTNFLLYFNNIVQIDGN